MIQSDLFTNFETLELKDAVEKLRVSNEKVRKCLFAKHVELSKNFLEMNSRIEFLEKYICNDQYADQQVSS